MLVTTATANKLIADVWFARADFAKDNPDIMEGLVRGIFDAMEDLKTQDAKQSVAKLMAAGYSIPESDALGMLGDAHSTNYAENREFFLNQNNPTNFERTWNTAYFLYKKIGAVTQQTPFDQVMDFSVIQKLGSEAKYASQKNEYDVRFAPTSAGSIQGESDEILTKTVVIHFFPNSWDVNKKITRTVDGKDVEELYDPNVTFVVEEIGKLAGQYGAARIVIEGHTDGSMRRQRAEERRAGAVAQPRQLGQGGDGAQVPDAAAEPVRDRGPRLGPAGRHAPIRTTTPRTGASRSRSIRQKPRQRRSNVRRARTTAVRASRRPAPPRAPPARGGRGGAARPGVVVRHLGRGGDAAGVAGRAAESRRGVLQLHQPAQRARAGAEHRRDAEARAPRLRSRDRWSAFRSGSPPARGACSKRRRAPLALFGRNLPVAALIPLTILWFGIDETQKVMFIFIACVPFVYSDAVARDRQRARSLRRDRADARRVARGRS